MATIDKDRTSTALAIHANEITSDAALLSHLVGQVVRTNLQSSDSSDILLLAAATESFLVFQYQGGDGSTVTMAWNRDYVHHIDFTHHKWTEQEVKGMLTTKVVAESNHEFFGTITLDHNEPAVTDKKKSGGGMAVGAVWTE